MSNEEIKAFVEEFLRLNGGTVEMGESVPIYHGSRPTGVCQNMLCENPACFQFYQCCGHLVQ